MPTYIAPGVYNEEIDLSLYAPMLSSSILGLVGGFRKGPLNTITLITNRTQFERVFGQPLRGDLGAAAHAALYFLRWGHQLKVVRVGDENIAKSTVNLLEDDSLAGTIGVIAAVSEGSWADGYQIVVTSMDVPSPTSTSVMETVYSVSIYAPGTGVVTSSSFDFSGVAPVEMWEDIVFDDPTDARFVEKIINGNSDFITITMSENANPSTTTLFTLAGGNDGTTALSASDIIGAFDVDTGVRTGLAAFEDPMIEDINLLSAPGFNHDRAVAVNLQTLALARFDCLAVLDTADVNTAQEMRDYVLGSLGTVGNDWEEYAPLASQNRSAIFGPWITIFDPYNNEEICVPPSVRVLGVFSYNDSVSYPWFAAAGPNRGVLQDTLNVKFRLSLGDVEATYGFGVNINPIQVTIDGIVVNGNKTLLRRPALTQNIHIVRMLMYAEKVIASASRFLQWEPHDPATWRRYVDLVEPFLRDIVGKRGITDFRVKCDNETNTPYDINNNQLVAELHIIPTTSVEKIINRYIIHQHGATLESQRQVSLT